MLHVAMYQPVIPPNVGAIGRQCVGLGAALHLIGPLSLDLSSQRVRRAGLDYWPALILHTHETPEAFLAWLDGRGVWLISKFGPWRYDRADYRDEDVLILGNENTGLPSHWHDRWHDRRVYIPIVGQIRSYNVSNCCAVVLTHASLQTGLVR
jgi:tRNA (cytidine/uridine-2'-O-)-methyltransferase